MDITGHVMGNTWIEKKLIEAAVGLQKGESLSQALSRQRIFHPVFLSMVAAAEESGHLEAVLKQAGIYYEKAAEQSAVRMGNTAGAMYDPDHGQQWWEVLFYPLCCRYSVCIQQCYKGGCDETLYLSYRR